MNSVFLDVFFPKHSYSEAPISVITAILSENDTYQFAHISHEFGKLGFTKVKDLAGATLAKVSSIKLSGDTLTLLYGAMEKYSERLDELLISAISEHENENLIETQRMCKELLMHKPKDLDVMLLYANSLFDSKKYADCIHCLDNARNIHPNNSEFLSKFAFLVYVVASIDSN
ncbi:uncharacterized protein LOC132946976 [Metopolophium dirhodum]|uniref:uncharacterized protein LOC132946976 n=1 Tax=Metopolophium dirhodum TaxID=44670 RepID=UPI0029906A68|nr:uncharacterized protein LOC132946976 [Metopolophium dirhodum]XP_060873105.1 uncharacterized protein LOC132946976 [Metopolophium dirhodum]XP_060873106.1 uncharacterized protein LOC132946976 [Metopolophium dirhodum]